MNDDSCVFTFSRKLKGRNSMRMSLSGLTAAFVPFICCCVLWSCAYEEDASSDLEREQEARAQRTAEVVAQMRAAGLAPTLAAEDPLAPDSVNCICDGYDISSYCEYILVAAVGNCDTTGYHHEGPYDDGYYTMYESIQNRSTDGSSLYLYCTIPNSDGFGSHTGYDEVEITTFGLNWNNDASSNFWSYVTTEQMRGSASTSYGYCYVNYNSGYYYGCSTTISGIGEDEYFFQAAIRIPDPDNDTGNKSLLQGFLVCYDPGPG